MKTVNTYGAELLDVMGSDLTVVNAARVSFAKESAFVEKVETRYDDDVLLGGYTYNVKIKRLSDADQRLIAFLAKHRHWTPFAHPQLSFRVKAPIFVARQLQKHQVGLAWNEVSRRYVDDEPEIYLPDDWRAQAANVKQGSSDEIVPFIDGSAGYTPKEWAAKAAESAVTCYNDMLASGVCPEQARMVLPQSMITEWVWTGSLYAFANVVNQRLDSHAQRECAPVAEAIRNALAARFPVSWENLRVS